MRFLSWCSIYPIPLLNATCYTCVMDRRSEVFLALEQHGWLGRLYRRLTIADVQLALTFCRENTKLDANGFEHTLNRKFLNGDAPKNWGIICELLSCANSAVKQEET